MEGITIIETHVLQQLIAKIDTMSDQFNQITQELKEPKSPYMNSKQVMAITGNGKTWLNENKHLIGFSKTNGQLTFKRSDVMEFIEQNYFKKSNRQ